MTVEEIEEIHIEKGDDDFYEFLNDIGLDNIKGEIKQYVDIFLEDYTPKEENEKEKKSIYSNVEKVLAHSQHFGGEVSYIILSRFIYNELRKEVERECYMNNFDHAPTDIIAKNSFKGIPIAIVDSHDPIIETVYKYAGKNYSFNYKSMQS